MSMNGHAFVWTMERICDTCKQPFCTMGPQVRDCAVCRNDAAYKAWRRQKKLDYLKRYYAKHKGKAGK